MTVNGMSPELTNRPVALITGASAGLGLALAHGLADRDWALIIDARGADALKDAADALADRTDVVPLAGDVTDPIHRSDLLEAVTELGRLDLLVNNASYLGPSPLQPLGVADLDELRRVYEVDVVAPIALTQALLPALSAASGVVLNISSDAAVEAYEGWGGYGSAKAALDHATAVLAAEHPSQGNFIPSPGQPLGYPDTKVIELRTLMEALASGTTASPNIDDWVMTARALDAVPQRRWVKIGAQATPIAAS